MSVASGVPSAFRTAWRDATSVAVSVFSWARAASTATAGHDMYCGQIVFGSVDRAAARASAACFCACAGVSWIERRYATRSWIDWSFFGPPPSTPQGCIGVPGRPLVMIEVTSHTDDGAVSGFAQPGSSSKRRSTVLSGGTCQVTSFPFTANFV